MATHSSVLAWRIPETRAWWAAVYGVTQSRTRLMRLSSSSRLLNLNISVQVFVSSCSKCIGAAFVSISQTQERNLIAMELFQ